MQTLISIATLALIAAISGWALPGQPLPILAVSVVLTMGSLTLSVKAAPSDVTVVPRSQISWGWTEHLFMLALLVGSAGVLLWLLLLRGGAESAPQPHGSIAVGVTGALIGITVWFAFNMRKWIAQ